MIAAGFVVCETLPRKLKYKLGDQSQPYRRRSVRRCPMQERTAETNVFPRRSQHGCDGNVKSGRQRDGRRILIVHHFVPEAGQPFGPDVLSIHVSLVANRGRDGVLPANVKTFMEIPSVLRVSVLCQKACVPLEIWTLVNIKLQGRLAWKSEMMARA